MDQPPPITRFSHIGRIPAILILLAATALAIAGIIASHQGKSPPIVLSAHGYCDEEIYLHIANRVHAGENYYHAAGDELRTEGFALKSVFAWRQPLYAWFFAIFPAPTVGRAILYVLAIAVILWSTQIAHARAEGLTTVIMFWLMIGAVWSAFLPLEEMMTEIWTGILIALSIFSYSRGNTFAAVAVALLALFIRELTGIYVVICIALALRNRHWRELLAWAGGLFLYTIYFAYHYSQVKAHILPTDMPMDSWMKFGGLHFVLNTVAEHLLLSSPPRWVAAIYLSLALLGLFSIPGDLGHRITLTVVAYLCLFAVAGKTFNDYWGYLDTPLLAFGCAWSPLAIMHLLQSITPPPHAGAERTRAAPDPAP
jgi:hypothetical protein